MLDGKSYLGLDLPYCFFFRCERNFINEFKRLHFDHDQPNLEYQEEDRIEIQNLTLKI